MHYFNVITPTALIKLGKEYFVDIQIINRYFSYFDYNTNKFTNNEGKNTIRKIATIQHIGYDYVKFLQSNKGNTIGIFLSADQIIIRDDLVSMIIIKNTQKKENMNLTFSEFKALASEYNIEVSSLDVPKNSFPYNGGNEFVSVEECYVKTMGDIIMLFRQNPNTHMGIYLQDDGDLFWVKDLVRYLRLCAIPMEPKPKPISVRQDIYDKIDEERAYQDLKWSTGQRPNQVPDGDKSVAEWLNYIEYHLDLAKKSVYNLGKEGALEEVRKITALAVRCMEIHGCPERKPIVKPKPTAKTVETMEAVTKVRNKMKEHFKKYITNPSYIHFQTETYQKWLDNVLNTDITKD